MAMDLLVMLKYLLASFASIAGADGSPGSNAIVAKS
jgi:hypothetical protein